MLSKTDDIVFRWNCLGIFLANLARKNIDYSPNIEAVQSAQYIEAGPTAILAVFIFLGSAFFLYLKARLGPGPYLFATIFACIGIDISMTTSVLYPFPFYLIGQVIAIPLAFHCALCIFFSAVIFPSTVMAQYTHTLYGVLDPLNDFLAQHRKVLDLDPSSGVFRDTVKGINGTVGKSEGGLGTAGVTARLLKQDVVYGRFSPTRIAELQPCIRRLVTRANGMNQFFSLIDPTRERFPNTPMPSRPATPRLTSPSSTRPGTPMATTSPPNGLAEDPAQRARRRHNLQNHAIQLPRAPNTLSRYLHRRLTHHNEEHHHHHLHFSLLNLAHGLSAPYAPGSPHAESAVGVFESQRYLSIEANRLSDRNTEDYTAQFVALLHESCDGLLQSTQDVLRGVQEWLAGARRGSFGGRAKVQRMRAERLEKLEELSAGVKEALRIFRKEKRCVVIILRLYYEHVSTIGRHMVLDPYRSAFDPKHVRAGAGLHDPPPHRYLFHCYMYQYHLMRFSSILTEVVSAMKLSSDKISV